MSPRSIRWWGLAAAITLNAMLDAYLVARLYSDLAMVAPKNRHELIASSLILISVGTITLLPLVSPRAFLPRWDLAIPLAICVSVLWPVLGLGISASLGV